MWRNFLSDRSYTFSLSLSLSLLSKREEKDADEQIIWLLEVSPRESRGRIFGWIRVDGRSSGRRLHKLYTIFTPQYVRLSHSIPSCWSSVQSLQFVLTGDQHIFFLFPQVLILNHYSYYFRILAQAHINIHTIMNERNIVIQRHTHYSLPGQTE